MRTDPCRLLPGDANVKFHLTSVIFQTISCNKYFFVSFSTTAGNYLTKNFIYH
jgi:hypothetical protein